MGKVSQAVPSAQRINDRLLASGQANLQALEGAEQRIARRRLDPQYLHPENSAKLDALALQVAAQKAVLADEVAAREALHTALLGKDKDAEQQARADLKALRAGHTKDYGKGQTVNVCEPCIDKKLASMRKVRAPQSPEAMSDLITGVFEGREPDYCAVADSPTDAGGLSYGKHQAAEKKGGLHKMLTAYVDQTDPQPDAAVKTGVAAQLAKFSATHDLYKGSASDRAAFKLALKSACADPAMRKTQDDFFAANYMAPALASAQALCVSSGLGRAMLYDLAIQSGPGRIDTLAPRAMKQLGKAKDGACSPCDPDGPDEPEFLQALNAERRKYVISLGRDAATSTYREDFFDDMLDAGNTGLDQDFVLRGIPVKGLPTVPAAFPEPTPAAISAPSLALPSAP